MALLLATLILAQALVCAMAAAVAGTAKKPAASDKKKKKYDEIEVGQDILSDQKFVYEIEWLEKPVAPTKIVPNHNGVNGWATIKATTNPEKIAS